MLLPMYSDEYINYRDFATLKLINQTLAVIFVARPRSTRY
jgi:hypothetical protein